MFEKSFDLNEQSMSFVEEIGRHMPGLDSLSTARSVRRICCTRTKPVSIYLAARIWRSFRR